MLILKTPSKEYCLHADLADLRHPGASAIKAQLLSNLLACRGIGATPPPPPTSTQAQSQATSLIFHRDEEKAAYIILPEHQQRETSLRYLHSHMHCQRFIVQGFNGALTAPLPPIGVRAPPSPPSPPHTHASTPGIHHSSPCFPRSSLSSLYQPSISLYFSFLGLRLTLVFLPCAFQPDCFHYLVRHPLNWKR